MNRRRRKLKQEKDHKDELPCSRRDPGDATFQAGVGRVTAGHLADSLPLILRNIAHMAGWEDARHPVQWLGRG